MPRRTPRRKTRRIPKVALGAILAGAVVIVIVPLAGMTYAAGLENHDAFCASCHTQPESRYYDKSLATPVDLASAHAAKDVTCIQCHSGSGATGRVSAMAAVALPDLLAFRSGHYHDPAVTTKPMGDDHCLKCHADVTRRRDFNNHFHVFLSSWQAQDPSAATCETCHISHVQGGDSKVAFLVESTTVAVCQSCHAFAGRG
jgi:predicted CXXCH cytochrome family protein